MYKFDDFELDPAQGLSRDGVSVELEPQALQLLEILVERRMGIVSKQDLIDVIWGGKAITDAALNTRIHSVRKALGDTASTSKFIKTYPKRGFQFVAPVSTGERKDVITKSKRRVSSFVAASVLLLGAIWFSLFGKEVATLGSGPIDFRLAA